MDLVEDEQLEFHSFLHLTHDSFLHVSNLYKCCIKDENFHILSRKLQANCVEKYMISHCTVWYRFRSPLVCMVIYITIGKQTLYNPKLNFNDLFNF